MPTCWMTAGSSTCRPLETTAVDTTGAGDTFCGGLAAGLARGLSVVESAALGAAVAAVAITGSGSLRLLRPGTDRAGIAATARRLAAAATEISPRPGGLPAGGMRTAGLVKEAGAIAAGGEQRSGADRRYDIDVMRREIAMIPDVVSDVLDDAGGQITALAKRLATRGVQHLWLTGCGDSAFAGLAAELAFQKHSGLTAHPVHALDLARYRARALPPGSAVIALSFSGKVGRTTEAAVQARRVGHHVVALTNAADGQLALASDEVLPLDVPTLGFSPGTSTYVAMLGTLLRLAAALAELRGDDRPADRAACPAAGAGRGDPDGGRGTRDRGRRGTAPGRLGRVPRRRPERGDRPVRRGEALRGPAAARRRDQPRGVGARGVLRDRPLATRSC